MTDFGSSVLSRDPMSRNASSHSAGDVVVGRGIVAHGMGQATLLLEVVVVPAAQFADGVLGEEFRGAAAVVNSQSVALAPFSQNSKGW